jgi:Holliday junction resolvasome RuvABC endonuclease subunit
MQLALDLGIATGYALSNGEFGVIHNNKVLVGFPSQPGKTLISAYGLHQAQQHFLDVSLPELCQKYGVHAIVYEEIIFGVQVKAIQAYGGFRFAVEYFAAKNGIYITPIKVTEWKKKALGKGSATKDQIRKKLETVGITHKAQDALDAVGIFCGGFGVSIEEYAKLQ